MREIKFSVSTIIKPVLKGYSPILLILRRNWQNILDEKYADFCEPEKIYFQKDKKNQGTLYLSAFNTVISFYLENNKLFIIEKMNSIFGYNVIKDIKIKQNPKIVRKKEFKEIVIDKEKYKTAEEMTKNIENEELRERLKELSIFI